MRGGQGASRRCFRCVTVTLAIVLEAVCETGSSKAAAEYHVRLMSYNEIVLFLRVDSFHGRA